MKKIIDAIRKIFKNMYKMDEIIKKEIKIQKIQEQVINSKEIGILPYKIENENIIISLTTYSKRIYDVYMTIESLLNQTQKPNKIILWLAEDEFTEEDIPIILKKMTLRGLEIGFCKDLKSYKKLIPTLRKYPNDLIITTDDDIIYPYDFVENLYKNYQKDKKCIYFYRGHEMKFDKKGNILPYLEWNIDYQKNEKSYIVLPTGVGGVLYPPNCFYHDILKEELFMELCPHGDDIWFKAMTFLKGIPCKKVKTIEKFEDKFIGIEGGQDTALFKINVIENKNDIQIKKVFDYYNLWNKIKESEQINKK